MHIPVFGPLKLSTGQKLPIRDVLYTPSPGFVLVGPRAPLPPAPPREPIEYAAVLLKCEADGRPTDIHLLCRLEELSAHERLGLKQKELVAIVIGCEPDPRTGLFYRATIAIPFTVEPGDPFRMMPVSSSYGKGRTGKHRTARSHPA